MTDDESRERIPAMRVAFYRAYVDADGHRHVHGANLRVPAKVRHRTGGIPPIACCEDVALADMWIATETETSPCLSAAEAPARCAFATSWRPA